MSKTMEAVANTIDAKIKGGVRSSLRHDSGHKHVSGEAIYADDIPEPPGTLQIYIAMSTRAHAAVTRLDVSKARSAPGVVCGRYHGAKTIAHRL